MKIEKIKKMKNGKYKIELDNHEKITLYDEVILKNNVLFKTDMDTDFLNQLHVDNTHYDIYHKVIKYISKKMRSQLEIQKYLEKNMVENKEEIMEKLKSMNLINDEAFVKAFISDKIHLTNMGPYKIKNELLTHQIDESLIDQELEKYEDQLFIDKVNKMIDKKCKMNRKSEKMFKMKMKVELYQLGYESTLVDSLLEHYQVKSCNITKECDKLEKQLAKKYTDKELTIQLRKKLYSKGYRLEEINEEIKKRIN